MIVSARPIGPTGVLNNDHAFIAGNVFYLHWAIKNVSDTALPETFRIGILVDGVLIGTVRLSGLEAQQTRTATNIPIRIDGAGHHRVGLLVDATNLVSEVNEEDDTYSVSIVQARPTPTLTPVPTATPVPGTRTPTPPGVVRPPMASPRATRTPTPTPTAIPRATPTPTRTRAAVATTTVMPSVNRAPVAEGSAATANEDGTALIILSGHDEDGEPLTFRISSHPSHGLLSAFTSTGPASTAITFAPEAEFNGFDSFTFRVSDGQLESAAALVNIIVLPVPDGPVADALSVIAVEDSPLVIVLSGTDADGDSLVVSIADSVEHGSLGNVTASGPTTATVVYTPSSDYNGPDSFSFRVTDGTQPSGASTVGITVTPVNDAPSAGDRRAGTDRETAVTISLVGSDIDGDSLAFSVMDPATKGTLGGVTSTGSTTATVVYTPNAGYLGPDTFTFAASDGSAASPPATVDIKVSDERFAVISHNEFPNEHYLDELGINWYLDYAPIMSDAPEGISKMLYISIPMALDVWTSGQAESIESLSDDELTALGFHIPTEIADLAHAAPGAYWYLMGEPNRYAGVTGARFAPVWHYYYTHLMNADPTAKVTSPSLLNWNFTCLGCSGSFICEGFFRQGYQCGKVWAKDFIAAYETRYGKKPPIDVWTIDVYPIDWIRVPNNAAMHAPIVIEQLVNMREYLDTIPEYQATPIWITEIAIHAGYDGWDWVRKDNGVSCNNTEIVNDECKIGPLGDYNWDLMGDYLISILDWLETDSAANRIEKWFFFITWLDIVNIGGSGYMGIIFFDGPTRADPLNCLGHIYRARAFGEPRVRCDHDGNVVPE